MVSASLLIFILNFLEYNQLCEQYEPVNAVDARRGTHRLLAEVQQMDAVEVDDESNEFLSMDSSVEECSDKSADDQMEENEISSSAKYYGEKLQALNSEVKYTKKETEEKILEAIKYGKKYNVEDDVAIKYPKEKKKKKKKEKSELGAILFKEKFLKKKELENMLIKKKGKEVKTAINYVQQKHEKPISRVSPEYSLKDKNGLKYPTLRRAIINSPKDRLIPEEPMQRSAKEIFLSLIKSNPKKMPANKHYIIKDYKDKEGAIYFITKENEKGKGPQNCIIRKKKKEKKSKKEEQEEEEQQQQEEQELQLNKAEELDTLISPRCAEVEETDTDPYYMIPLFAEKTEEPSLVWDTFPVGLHEREEARHTTEVPEETYESPEEEKYSDDEKEVEEEAVEVVGEEEPVEEKMVQEEIYPEDVKEEEEEEEVHPEEEAVDVEEEAVEIEEEECPIGRKENVEMEGIPEELEEYLKLWKLQMQGKNLLRKKHLLKRNFLLN
ncbi:Plasmodium exported protein, unknown function [Plasmodium knowlesi strain H]|uniref:Erythrocyte membrane antigen 1 n=2 Tax=Plasmodium knowlesi (strain H) TaxID=5851 RepID=A0A679KW19_PLAKH|nr:Plasmodium exported protein, unknown function [Plasmodium knowlesi strain H]CAA9986275.1 Plasmodium exported protein, unknown function [Plasmodium knowlesi strain H]SBO25490.1 Plasmodium exported protein, unknown function [Plasmodium knowlesi strain H]VVS75749.1 Plasmodium exported protein, unknown function [Plasmodium knowlesi strain H]